MCVFINSSDRLYLFIYFYLGVYLCNIRRLYYLECCNIKMKTLVPAQNEGVTYRTWISIFKCVLIQGLRSRRWESWEAPGPLQALVRRVYVSMVGQRRDQTLVALGRSGSGKTTSCQSFSQELLKQAGTAGGSLTCECIHLCVCSPKLQNDRKQKPLNVNLHTGWIDSLESLVVTGLQEHLSLTVWICHWICVNLLLLMLNDRWNTIVTV